VAGDDSRYWIWPAVVLALLVATGVYSARRSPVAANGRRVGWWLGVVLPVALATASTSLSLSAAMAGAGGTALNFSGDVGFDLLFVILLGAGLGLAAGMVGAAIVPRTPPMGPAHPLGLPPMGRPGFGPEPGYPPGPGYQQGYPEPGYGPGPGYPPPGYPPQMGPPIPPQGPPPAYPPLAPPQAPPPPWNP
jgi:hypothetical protein